MPVMDGLEATEKIMELDTGIPVVAMTANIMTHDRELYKRKGMHDYVGKPFTSQELWHCLMKYFKPVSCRSDAPEKQEPGEKDLKQRLINIFVKCNRGIFGEILNAIGLGDNKLAHRLVHTLKSNAGQLKMTRLQKAAEEVEKSLAGGSSLVNPRQLAVLKSELNATLAELTPLVVEPVRLPAAEKLLENEAKQKLLEELEPLLLRGNPECLTLIDNLRLIPGSEELIHQMEDFNFNIALERLADLKKQL
jgi:CheY-like chemotaxis protein